MIDVSAPNYPQDEANGVTDMNTVYEQVSVYAPDVACDFLSHRIMQEIIPGVFLGPFTAAQKHCLLENEIRYIVCVRQDGEAHFIKPQISDPNFTYLTLNIADNANENIIRFFPKVRQFIDEALSNNCKVLVHGNNGNSRSATLVLAYIMEKFGLSSSEALEYVKEKRASVNPNEGFRAQLVEYEPIYKARQILANGESSSDCRQKRTLCKSRWGNMRDNFRKSLKKHKTRSGKKKVKVYKYSEQMSFIIDFFEDREQVCKSDAEVTNQYFTGDDDTTELMSHDNEENMKHFKTEVDDPLDVDLQSGTSSISIPTGSTEQPIPRKRIKQSVENTFPSNVAAATVTGYLVKRNDDTGSSPSPSQHPVDAFLSGIAPVLKKLPPQYWHYAKADIFTAVQKYELKMLMDQEQFGESYHIPT